MKKWLVALTCVAMDVAAATGAINIAPGTPVAQDFDSIGTNAVATLPADWKVDKQTLVRTVGTFSAAVSATEQRITTVNFTANGIYNYSAPTNTSADRAIGFLSSSAATKSGNLYVQMVNSGGAPITNLDIAYDVEKYRNGSNAGGYQIQLYYSTDGATWTSAGATFLTTFPADADNNGFSPFPGSTTAVSGWLDLSATPIAAGASVYLAWCYSVQSTTTTSNGQGLGVDSIVISVPGEAVFGVTVDKADGFTVAQDDGDAITATAANGTDPYVYAWDSTLGALHYTASDNSFTIHGTAPIGDYSATVTAHDSSDPFQEAQRTVNFSVVPAYGITITPPVDGTVTTTPASRAIEGATVTITATPVDGAHRVASIAVVDAALNPVTVNGHTFTMPGSAVTVTVLFEAVPASRILISQYTETDTGTTPKGIEIWNVSGADITFDGTANLLDVKVGSGGGAPVSVVTANSGTLAAGEVWVVGTADMTPDLAETFVFNGDDAVVLELGGAVQDVLGTPGVDPGNSWTNAGVSTANQNIQLKDGISTGDLDGWSDPSERFEYVAAGSVLTGFGIAPGGAAAFGVTVDRTNGFVLAEGSSAAITATAANGTPEYGYSWSTTVAEGQYTAAGNVFTILATAPAGGYSATVTATDSSDPVQTAEKTVTFLVAALHAITITPPVDGTVTTTPADEAIAGAPVTITATPVDGNHRVASIAVVDAASNPVTVTGNAFVMPASAVTVTVLFEAYDAPDARIDFEDYAGSYARNEYVAGGVTWTMTNAFAGATADDSKNGEKSGRFENNRGGAGNPAKMTSAAFAEPVTKINFFYANYGVNDGGAFKVQVSANGADWTDVGAAEYNPASKTLVEGVIDAIPADMTHVQFITTAGTAQRVNIDDIGIYFGAATPTLSYAGATTIQLGESFALEFTLNGATASGWEYLLEGSGREDLDNGSVNTFSYTPTFAGTYYLTMTALDEAVNPIATREVVLTVESGLPPADIGAITFLPTSGNFTFELPAGYTTPVVVYGADAAVGASGNWGFSNLTEGVHYTRDGATVTILTAPQSRQIIRIGVSSNPD